MQSIDEKIAELEKRQTLDFNPDRQWNLHKLRLSRDGKLDNIATIRKSRAGKLAVNPGTSGCEALFAERAREAGWLISKRGWPDFLMWKDGKIACVEVKKDLQSLRANQKAILEALASYGVPCFTWRPLEGFKRVSGNEANRAIEAAL